MHFFPLIIFSKNIEIITIQELFYIFDEIEELSEYKKYEIFLEKCKNFFLVDRINYFSAFKMAKGELIKGAENYNKIALDPNMAEEYRCESLKKREKLLKYVRYGHLKNWKIKNIENKIETYNILTNEFSECIEIDKKIIFISFMKVHFIEELTMENKDLIFNIISMIEKYFVLFKDFLKNDFLFSEKENILIKIFPSSLLDKKDFIHLNHLKNKKIFNSDCSLIKEMYIVRVVIDIKNFKKEFLKAPNCILETKLFLEIIKNLVCKNIYIEILKQVSELEYKESEFKLIEIRSLIPNREVYFGFIVEEEYFIKARKEIAILLEKEKIENTFPNLSEENKKDFEDIYGKQKNSLVIRNYLDYNKIIFKSNLEEDLPYDNKTINLVMVSRLTFQKGIDRFIKIYHKLESSGVHSNVYIVGDGPLRFELQKQIDALGETVNFMLLGEKTNPYPYIKNADIFCLLSYFEGYGMVVEEAKILNKKIIITDTAARESFGDYANGMIVPNTEKGIFDGLSKMIKELGMIDEVKSTNSQSFEEYYDDIIRDIKILFNGEF